MVAGWESFEDSLAVDYAGREYILGESFAF